MRATITLRSWYRNYIRRQPLSAAAALLAVLLVGLLTWSGLLERAELITQDLRFRLRPPRPSAARIVLVEVDEATVRRAWPEPMAFWGDRFGQVVRQLDRQGARVIGFDFTLEAAADRHVVEQLQATLEAQHLDERTQRRLLDNLSPALRPNAAFIRALEAINGLPDDSGRKPGKIVLAADPNDTPPPGELLPQDTQAAQGSVGYDTLLYDPDGTVRRLSLYYRRPPDDVLTPSFAALVAARARGLDAQDEAALRRLAGLPSSRADSAEIGINYLGEKPRRAFPRLSAARVATGELSAAEREQIRDAVVLIGAAYPGAADWHTGPGGQEYYGVEVQAQEIATLLDGVGLRRAGAGQEALLALGLAVLFALPLLALPFGRGLLVVLTGAIGWGLLAQGLFASRHVLLPVAGPLLALGLPFAAFHMLRSVEEGWRRLQIERVFGRSVSPAICAFLLANPEHLRLGGQRAEGSVLFMDLRDSAAFAERRDPREVFAELNVLFDRMVPVIEAQGGLVYRLLGDGLMAVFGVPSAQPEHAQQAVDAAMEIVQTVHALNADRGQQAHGWAVGCGVHTGALAVGNLGHAERAEFTVIGDTVNLAARLEGLNKALHSEIVVSEETYAHLVSPPPLCGPEERKIAGHAPVRIYYGGKWDAQGAGR